MTKFVAIGFVALFVSVVIFMAGNFPITRVRSGDYDTHVIHYKPECEGVLKRYMPNEHKQHFKNYAEYVAMVDALKTCGAHATPGLVKTWVWMPISR
jgi:hypothetical protein